MRRAPYQSWLLLLLGGVAGCANPCLDDGLLQSDPASCPVAEDPADSTGEVPSDTEGPPPCFNGVKDDDEADVDCGGLCSALCQVGQGCAAGADCETALCEAGVCVAPASCDDGIKGDEETDQDCGGVCGATCPIDAQCDDFADCQSFVCDPETGLCAGPRCDDGAPNGDETDVDCGGSCGPCADGGSCETDSDCVSGACDPTAAVCVDPSCANGSLDAGETDLDCGGELCAPCDAGESCEGDTDCLSQVCDGGTCAAASCQDGVENQGETDVDCGGPNCDPCNPGQSCEVGSDCVTNLCDPVHDICEAESCVNGIADGAESDVDCGGDVCAPCDDGGACELGSDCASANCVTGTCAAANCMDDVLNGNESDVDCGGDSCGPCESGEDCLLSSDCVSMVCLVEVCQVPTCDDGVRNADESDEDCGGFCGSTCETGETCSGGEDCVSHVCDPESGTCAAPQCDDGERNGDETDVDCGGLDCEPCQAPGMCEVPSDCVSEVCTKGLCVPAACNDGVRNGTETDVDCGGDTCAPCDDGESCGTEEDCSSLVCSGGTCIAPTCDDGVRNGAETDVDCGGDVCSPCDDGEGCGEAADCISSVCDPLALVCEAPTCIDGVLNGTETDVDCGGGACSGCDTGEDCSLDADCTSLVCNDSNVCDAPTCGDGVQNQDETDVDCGGDICGPCGTGQACEGTDDCVSMVCLGLVCQPSACDDGVRNADETDVDCGGSCQPCDDGESCIIADDCISLVCDILGSSCTPATCSDGVRNQGESDQDCGGPCGSTCATGEGCNGGGDCISLVCDGATDTCAAPTCGDGVQNQGETDVDCGGPCGATCTTGEGCDGAGDCVSLVCDGGTNTCAAATCGDGVQNQGESDLDCGGPCGATCDTGEGCSGGGDCTSLVCDGTTDTCDAPTCSDGVQNGSESDADCGGSCGSTCATGETCVVGLDCISLVCDGATDTCDAPTCSDGVQNGSETDADCGGSCGATCDTGESCGDAGDCISGVCDGVSDTCVAPSCNDGIQNADETGLDCGGSCGATCDTGESCDGGEDCVSAGCDGGSCNGPLSVVITPNACADAAGGPISYTAVASGGTGGPYTYAWTPDDGTVVSPTSASTTILPLEYASYTVTVDDGVNNATAVGVVVLSNQAFNLQNNCTLYTGLGLQPPNNATIAYSSGGTVATELGNNDIGLHLCDEVAFTNVRLTGEAIVSTTADDDWFGYIWGAQDASHFYILSWKQAGQNFFNCASNGGNSPAGIIVKRVFAPSFGALTGADLYCANNTAQSQLLLGTTAAYATGWADNTRYSIEIEYRPTGSDIRVRNLNTATQVAAFSMSDTTYTSGYFGSHTLSQEQVSVGPLVGQCL